MLTEDSGLLTGDSELLSGDSELAPEQRCSMIDGFCILVLLGFASLSLSSLSFMILSLMASSSPACVSMTVTLSLTWIEHSK